MALYQKYRPTNIEEMFGKAEEFRAFESLIKSPADKRPHSFLLAGASGCGKTTLARMAATWLGCRTPIEMNAAEARGIDTAREIQDLLATPPMSGSMVFILDECHKTTSDFQNAMLKLLEDTPPYAYFFLCTTDPQKIVKPVQTRCTKVSISPLSDGQISQLIRRVAAQEPDLANVPDAVFAGIVRGAEGSARTALVILEKCAGQSPEDMEKLIFSTEAESDETIGLCRALLERNWTACKPILKSMKGSDSEAARRAILGYMSAVATGTGKGDQALRVLYVFRKDTYNSGVPGLVSLCHEACCND
jgi:DNA polymerase-3 subunit gamma/tau